MKKEGEQESRIGKCGFPSKYLSKQERKCKSNIITEWNQHNLLAWTAPIMAKVSNLSHGVYRKRSGIWILLTNNNFGIILNWRAFLRVILLRLARRHGILVFEDLAVPVALDDKLSSGMAEFESFCCLINGKLLLKDQLDELEPLLNTGEGTLREMYVWLFLHYFSLLYYSSWIFLGIRIIL